MNTVYLDWNATAPLRPQARAEMCDVVEHAWANPSSTHAPGQAARRVLVDARARIAAFVGAQVSELVFTSGATESNHAAVLGALAAARGGGRRRLLVSAVEHPGLLALADHLAASGTPLQRIPVNGDGRIDLRAARALLGADVALLSVMGANNETGVQQPIAELAVLAAAQGVPLHVDATQMLGKVALDFAASGAQFMSLSAHKIGGPKGVGALLLRKGTAFVPLIHGRQERQRRGGTENLPGIAGFAAAAQACAATLQADIAAMRARRDRLEHGLCRTLPGVVVHGTGAERLPNTSCLSFGALSAGEVLARLERAGIVAASGAACSAGGTQPSHVLLAMGLDADAARRGVRFSLGPDTTDQDIEQALAAAQRVLQPLLESCAEAA